MPVVLTTKNMSVPFKNWIASKTETCHFHLETDLLAKQKYYFYLETELFHKQKHVISIQKQM